MKEPALVVMAAGMGSRFGGLKQIEPVGKNGEIIMDFSIFDARKAGFKKVICVIKKEMESDFKQIIGDRISKNVELVYAYQEIDDLPEGYKVPEGRAKPWGTGHAILACRDLIDGPFAVINADDYYGKNAFKLIYDFLINTEDDDYYRYAMVGYILENTLTDHGHVARGVCTTDENGYLKTIHERTRIEKRDGLIQYTEDGSHWVTLPDKSIVSMNLWGFTPSIMEELKAAFPAFLDEALKNNPEKAEFYIPEVVNNLIKSKKALVKVLESKDRWYGVTYREDKDKIVEAITKMQEEGIYPDNLSIV
ncbi:nucleotidyltransferase family protein [Defluviitalea saccharophila]|uniref:Sugar phosphate nucleotidyltransferase n=1 Tax=Defluviitalea saccharophila TaxID=879970 RepID=A0ABZ2Y6Q5_9FIRM|nr:nucleotidyltransferase [Candidatus Epulonipiscium sp.]